MAKVIRISNDAGVSWMNLPGSQGSFNCDAEAIDDTILGATYGSSEIGLITWGVSSDGIYKGFAGYKAKLKKPGAAVIANAEPMTQVGATLTYQVTDPAHEIWDRTDTVVVYDNAVEVDADDILYVDYLFGRVTFVPGYVVTGPITVDISYFPTVFIGRANQYTLTMSADSIDETYFESAQNNNGTRLFKPGLRSVALELTGIWTASENAKQDLINRAETIVEIDPAGDGSSIARGFFKRSTTGQSGAVGALEEQSINMALNVPTENVGPAVELPFNWRHNANSTLSPAIQAAIQSWLDELNTHLVQYLPSGAPGQAPDLDGIQGKVVFTDISLSGGLSAMNVFNVEMQGNDQFTEV